ncbi:MAG: mRNA interferase RelE/StbE [Bacillota bacterium]|nr:mRNA interferase RelE/StbE [Bacillota bacterium]
MTVEQDLERLLGKDCRTKVILTRKAVADIEALDRGLQSIVVAAIVRRARGGPLLKPRGLGEPLGRGLAGVAAKIKLKRHGMRIVYRPVERGDAIVMEILAVGPRDAGEVYREVARRLNEIDKDAAGASAREPPK